MHLHCTSENFTKTFYGSFVVENIILILLFISHHCCAYSIMLSKSKDEEHKSPNLCEDKGIEV